MRRPPAQPVTIAIQMNSNHCHAQSVLTRIPPLAPKTASVTALMHQLVTTTMKLVKFSLKLKRSFALQAISVHPVLSLALVKAVLRVLIRETRKPPHATSAHKATSAWEQLHILFPAQLATTAKLVHTTHSHV